MKTYRCKRVIEALRWTDTDDDRELFSAWFERHGVMFETLGPIVRLPQKRDESDVVYDVFILDVKPGDWIVWVDDEFVPMGDREFLDVYEEIP